MNTHAPKKTRDDHSAKGGKTAKVAKADAELAEALRPGQSVELLKELHILTREGRLNQDSRRKLKQVYHLCLLYTSPSPRDKRQSRMPSSA